MSEVPPTEGDRFVSFLASLPGKQARIHILTDSDADGLPAAALLVRSLHGAGYPHVTAEVRRKFETPWTEAVGERLRDLAPDALIVTDLGSRAATILDGVPTLLIDHHNYSGVPLGATLITSYRAMEPGEDAKSIATTGLLAYRCAKALIGEKAESLLWLAGISLLSDLGEKAPFPELALAKKQFGAGALRDATALLNAPRRAASGDASSALELLLEADSPKDLLSSESVHIAQLREELMAAKREVSEAMAEARKQPPRFSTSVREELGADLVAVRMATPCQVHPLVAQQWRGRFMKSVVFGVNTAFRPGWVHFSGRAPKGVNLIDFLRRHRPAGADGAYGNGHDQAAGGALPIALWNAFALEIGFGPEMQVEESA